MHSFTPLCTHWPLSGHLFQGNQRITHRKIERPKRLFQNEMLFFFCFLLIMSVLSLSWKLIIELWSQSWSLAMAEYYMLLALRRWRQRLLLYITVKKKKRDICHLYFYFTRAEWEGTVNPVGTCPCCAISKVLSDGFILLMPHCDIGTYIFG